MTNENLKVDEVLKYLGITYSNMAKEQYPSSDDCENVYAAINLIKSKQSHIELLESAIREFLKCDLRCELSSFNHESCEGEDELRYIARTNLEKLLENEK